MKRTFLLLIISAQILFSGCRQNQLTQRDPFEWIPNADLYGIWSGSWPCKDCDAMAYKLIIQKAGIFREEIVKIDGANNKVTIDGTWQMLNDSVLELCKMSGEKSKFLFKRNELGLLNQSDNAVLNRYILYKSDAISNFELQEEMRKKGVDFIAKGKNPDWTLSVDFDKEAIFHSEEKDSIKIPVQEKIDPDKVEVKLSKDQKLNVSVRRELCTASNSMESLPYNVYVIAGQKEYTGCGNYLGDWRLHDIWALKKFNESNIKQADFSKGAPYLEFNVRESKVYGHAGCNSISGSFIQSKNIILIGNLVSTKMICSSFKFEEAFIKALSGKNFSYSFDSLRLTLSDKQNKFEFAKVD